MPFLIAFFVLYSTMTFLFNLVNRQKSTLLEVLGLLDQRRRVLRRQLRDGRARPTARSGWPRSAWRWPPSTRPTSTTSSLRRLLDRELLLSFTALSAFFLAVTIPLVLSSQWITASWAIQALVMLWIAGKLESEFLRQVVYLLYAIVLCRFGFVDLRDQYFVRRGDGRARDATTSGRWSSGW